MFPRYCCTACLGALLCLGILGSPAHGGAQQFTQFFSVDCSNPGAQYPTIGSALAVATNNSYIYVKSGTTCTENVTVGYLSNVTVATDWQLSFNLAGSLTIQSSHSVWIQGAVVTNPYGDGIDVNNSTDVTFDFASSVNNLGIGLAISTSDVSIADYGTFDNNGNNGINASGNSTLGIDAWGGVVDISNNLGSGLNLDRSVAYGLGSMTITNNQAAPGATFPAGFGITEVGASRAGMFGIFGPLTIASNQGGAVSVQEGSEISIAGNVSWAPYLVTIQGNGPLGVLAEFGSQVTLYGGTQISDHTTAGVSLYGNSQAAIYNVNSQIVHNGIGTDPDRAGIQVENGSQAYIRGATILNNGGPGILGLVHATLDVAGSTFGSNASGAIVCDGSTALETDLAHSVLGAANKCLVESISGNHNHDRGDSSRQNIPDWKSLKARATRMHQIKVRH